MENTRFLIRSLGWRIVKESNFNRTTREVETVYILEHVQHREFAVVKRNYDSEKRLVYFINWGNKMPDTAEMVRVDTFLRRYFNGTPFIHM